MDVKVYIWLKNNIERYNYSDNKAITVKDTFLSFFQTTDGSVVVDGNAQLEQAYTAFLANFYNNILGYKNGFADQSITSEELDCYFINTSEGTVPIGYYKEQRPVESAMLVNKYIEQCQKDVNDAIDLSADKWNEDIEEISVKYEEKKTLKYSNVLKCIVFVSLSGMIFLMSVIAFFMSGGFSAFDKPLTEEFVYRVQQTMPCLARTDASGIFAFAVCMFILAIITLFSSAFFAWELKLALDKKVTDDLLDLTDEKIEKIKIDIAEDISKKTDDVYTSARQGMNCRVMLNDNANAIRSFGRSISVAKKFVVRKRLYTHSAVGAVLGVLAVLIVLCFTNLVPIMQQEGVYKQATALLEEEKYTEARIKFRTIEAYKDSNNKIIECRYGEANAMMDKGEFLKAKEEFIQFADYKDSKSLITECDYGIALSCMKNEDYLTAYELLYNLGNYRDSESRFKSLKRLLYNKGVELYNSDSYLEAKKHFEKSVDYDREADYMLLIAVHQGARPEISKLYELIDLADVKDILLENEYIMDFLEGNWRDGDGHFLSYKKKRDAYDAKHNLPHTSGSYFKVEDGGHYTGEGSYDWDIQWKFTIIDMNTIEVFCYNDSTTYTLNRG